MNPPPNPLFQKEGEHAIVLVQKEETHVMPSFEKRLCRNQPFALRHAGRTANKLIFNVPQSAHGELVEP